jgi:hypothetical protein
MRDRFPGFYRPSDEEFETFFSDGLVCVDANVLLSLYRVSDSTREDVFSIFAALGERLWLPHQVVLEFQRNRRAVIREQEEVYDQLEKELKGFPSRLTEKVRRHHPRIDREELEKVVRSAVSEIEVHLDDLRAAHPEPLSSDDALGADVVRDRLEEIIDGRIGHALDPIDIEREGKARYAKRIPPGYADVDKGDERKYGDLMVWLELLAEAERRGGPTLLVTDDAKEDWWIKDGSKTIGPRPELVQEMGDKAGCQFWMYRFEPFLSFAAEHFGIELGATVGAEVADAQEPRITLPPQWQWNQHPFPLGSGAVTGHRDPERTEFVFSPSNPTVLNASRYPSSELDWQLSRPSEVEVTGEAVEIRLHRDPSPLAVDVTCSVTDPQGVTTSVSMTPPRSEATIEVSYPFEGLGGGELQPGTYRYRWVEAMGAGGLAVVVSQGNFAVPA